MENKRNLSGSLKVESCMIQYPMISGLGKTAFNNKDWLFELKWDGFRCVSNVNRQKAFLKSKNGNSLNSRFPCITSIVQDLPFDCILDGELVVLNQNGYSCFDSLIARKKHNYTVTYIVFDLLEYNGESLLKVPLMERKELLKEILPKSDKMRYCDYIEENGEAFFNLTQVHCLEGIVAKNKESIYKPGEVTKDWVKIKNQVYSDKVSMKQRFKTF